MAADRRLPPQPCTAPAAAGAKGQRGRVLVVDDETLNQIATAATLSVLGYEAKVVSNGWEAVAAVSREEFVAVLMDCQMPEMDGYEATAEIRRLEAGISRTPIIALTAAPRDHGPQACLAAGMDDYLTKPASKEEMRAALERWRRSAS